jgi:hypothetical protein
MHKHIASQKDHFMMFSPDENETKIEKTKVVLTCQSEVRNSKQRNLLSEARGPILGPTARLKSMPLLARRQRRTKRAMDPSQAGDQNIAHHAPIL